MKCTIIEDLYPLYDEGLVHEETAQAIEVHLSECPACAKKLRGQTLDAAAYAEKPRVDAAMTVKKTESRLAMYQLFILLLSFYFAMTTNIMAESFGFILTYFLLGLVVFLFYRSWKLTLFISFLPVFFIAFVDTALAPNAYRLYKADHLGGNIFVYIWMHSIGALMLATMHTIFAMLGALVGQFIMKLREENVK